MAHAELERERTRELARIGSNLNQIARWANTRKENAEAVEVVAHLVAIERALGQGLKSKAQTARIDVLQRVIWPLIGLLATTVFGLLYRVITG